MKSRRGTSAQIEAMERRLLMAVIAVTNNNDSGAGSLRQAIADAQAGDIVNLSGVSGTIALSSTLAMDKDLIITGPGAKSLVIQGNGLGCAFGISAGTTSISGLTITQPSGSLGSYFGGGIYNSGNLTLNDVVVKNCTVTDRFAEGGGIYSFGMLSMTDCSVTGNTARNTSNSGLLTSVYGGGIYSFGPLTLTNCTIANNTATNNINVNPDFPNPGLKVYGGGVDIAGNSPAKFINCTFTGNSISGSTTGSPGGTVEALGGAIRASLGAAFDLTNCTIVGNSAAGTNLGGSVVCQGGGMLVAANGGTFTNCIIAQNIADTRPDLYCYSTIQGTYNLIGQLSDAGYYTGAGDRVGTSAEPIDPMLNALADNGGPTQTMSLKPDSPAINAGDNATAPETDQRGYPRVANADIGAFESATPNRAPQFDSDPLTLPIISRTQLSFLVTASDPDGDSLTITAPVLPAWITLHDNGNGTALLSGTPVDSDGGINDLTLRVSDGTLSVDQTSSFVVAAPRFQLDGGVLTIAGGIDANDIHIWIRGTDQVRAVYNGLIKNFSLSAINQVEVYGFDGDDTLIVNMRTTPTYVLGGAGDDMIFGYDEPDNLVGGGGKDYIDAGSNDDRLDGGNGKDTLLGGDGDDRLYGGDDNDDLVGGAGTDQIDSGAGTNLVYAKDSAADQIWPGVNDLIDKDDIDLLFVLT